MELKLAIKESDLRAAALYLRQSRSLYVVAQYGPFTFPGNFIDVHYTTEIHRYNNEGNPDFAIISFSPINWIQLGLHLGTLINDDRWVPYGSTFSEKEVKSFRRRDGQKSTKEYPRKLINPRFRDGNG